MKKYLLNIKGYVILSILFSVFEAIITSIILLFPGWLVDNFKNGITYIIRLTVLYMITFTMYLIVAYFSNRIADYRRIKFEKAIKRDFFDSITNRRYGKYHEFETAEYISMQANDITELCQNYLSPLLSIFRSLLLIITFSVSLILFVNYYVATIVFAFSFIVILIPKITAKQLEGKNRAYLDRVGKYTSQIMEMFEAHDILDNRGRKKIKQKHDKDIEDALEANMKFRKINSLAMVINGGSVEFVSIITFIAVALLLFNGKITAGMATIAFTYSTRFMEPIYELNVCIGKVLSVKKVGEKIVSIINCNGHNEEIKGNIKHIKMTQLKKVYENTEINLPQIRFEYPHKYLITGKNGVGKSVLLRLIMRFESPDSGKIDYGCNQLTDISEDICYIPQKSIIFNATYIDNVTIFHAYDDSKLSLYESFFPNEIIESIKRSTSPSNLSGGEKQVIGLIRALCSDKKILIMDEPFSAMNQTTIDCFMVNMKKIDRMVILVAHNVDEYREQFDQEIQISR